MSENAHLDAALQYHSGTKHTYQSLRMHPHSLDWDNKPLLFKIYPTLEVTRLPRDFHDTGRSALSAIADPGAPSKAETIPDLETLAQLLFFSAGVIRSKKHPDGETFFRAAACTGALYEIELYVVCTDLPGRAVPGVKNPPGLAAGVYHFGAAETQELVTERRLEDRRLLPVPVVQGMFGQLLGLLRTIAQPPGHVARGVEQPVAGADRYRDAAGKGEDPLHHAVEHAHDRRRIRRRFDAEM